MKQNKANEEAEKKTINIQKAIKLSEKAISEAPNVFQLFSNYKLCFHFRLAKGLTRREP